jgi:mono/diheme cytochrome c family protein
MPGFGGVLTDEGIWAVLAYIKSSWPSEIRRAQDEMTRERGQR